MTQNTRRVVVVRIVGPAELVFSELERLCQRLGNVRIGALR